MKAATGELNLTLITVVALGAVLALFTGIIWPSLKEKIGTGWNDSDTDLEISYNYVEYDFPKCIESDLF